MKISPVYLVSEIQRATAHQRIDESPLGNVMRLVPPTKKRIQEEKYHAMIDDISKCVRLNGNFEELETWKRLLMHAFVNVMRDDAKATGKPDPFDGLGRVMPSLDGREIVQIGVPTSGMTIALASQFIEHLYAYGSERDVVWTESNKIPSWADVKAYG